MGVVYPLKLTAPVANYSPEINGVRPGEQVRYDVVNRIALELLANTDWLKAQLASHSHGINAVTGLSSALAGKVAASEKGITVATLDGSGKVPAAQLPETSTSVSSVNSRVGAVVLAAADVGAAPATHSHAIGDTTGLQPALDAKAAAAHNHTIGEVATLQTTLDGKAATTHSHAVADTTGLQAALDGKAPTAHNQAASTITDFAAAAKDNAAAMITGGTHTNISFTYDAATRTLSATATASGTGGGTVTSVAAAPAAGAAEALLAITVANATTTPAITVDLDAQAANQLLAGPASGVNAKPGFRSLIEADIPALAQTKIANLPADLGLKAPAASPTFTGQSTFNGPVGQTLGGRFMNQLGVSARYLNHNPNVIKNPSGELGLDGWTVVTAGGLTTFIEADGRVFRTTGAFEIYTDVPLWRNNKDVWVSGLAAFQCDNVQYELELRDSGGALVGTNPLVPWTFYGANGFVQSLLNNTNWIGTAAAGFLRVKLRGGVATVHPGDMRFRGIAVNYSFPTLGGGYPVEVLRWLYDNRGIATGTIVQARQYEFVCVGGTNETKAIPTNDADGVAHGTPQSVEYGKATFPVETLDRAAWSFAGSTLTLIGSTLADARVIVHFKPRLG